MNEYCYGVGGYDPSKPHNNLVYVRDVVAMEVRELTPEGEWKVTPFTAEERAVVEGAREAARVAREAEARKRQAERTLASLDEGSIREATAQITALAESVRSDGRVAGTTKALADASVTLAGVTDQLAGLVPVARALMDGPTVPSGGDVR